MKAQGEVKMTAQQGNMFGNPRPATGHRVGDQLAQLMEEDPKLIDDEDLLASLWLQKYCPTAHLIDYRQLAVLIGCYRKANIRERRRELKKLYPYSPEEEARRQKVGRGGRPRRR